MCSGGTKRKPSQIGLIKEQEYGRQGELHHKISALLEFSATDDVKAFKDAVEKDDHDVDEVGLWYGRRVGSKEMCYEERTPVMIAAMFGSKGVLSYILGTGRVDVNRACGSDGATALHCAVAGGSSASPEVIKLLLDASADVSSVDANGNRSGDLIVSVSNSIFSSRKRILQAILEGADDIDEVYLKEAVGQMGKQQHQDDVGTPQTEKKDYPVDLSLPDINNGIYSTDEFRMFTFKVKPCSRAYSHDWTECPFVHPGENARRRDLRKYHYSCVPCPEFRKGSCSKGDGCEYAHGIFECWLHPAQYRTRLCKDETRCTRRVCFFAHKPEELRPLYASTGSALPSPRSYSHSASSMDAFTLASPSSLMPPSSTPPLTPSEASPPMNGTMWQKIQPHAPVPSLQLPRSRLKTALNARDTDLDIELIGLENHLMRKILMEEMVGLSPPSKWNNSMPNSPSFPEDIFRSQLQSPTGIQMHQNVNQQQNMNQQLWGYPSDISASNVIGSPTFRVDQSRTAATVAMNPRYAAFSKRSQSFIERSVASSNSELHYPATPVSVEASTFSGWGSPDGKLDWAVRGDELNKLRKSSSFGFRNSNSSFTMASTTAVPLNVDEPDVSWVNSLVKDAPTMESDQYCGEEQLQCHNETYAVPSWPEQLYMEQEQMVA